MKLTNLFLGLSLFIALMLTGCTPAGADLGMVGKWKSGETTMEIKSDDTITLTTGSLTFNGKITKADSAKKEITTEFSGVSTTSTYELTCTTLKIGDTEYTKQ